MAFKMNFITKHLIGKINEQIKQKQATLKHDHFYYFDEPVKDRKRVIDRINRWNPYVKNEVLPSTWYAMDGTALHELYSKLKKNQFYIYKKLDGKSHKIRIKQK
jgi:hypothetical protein